MSAAGVGSPASIGWVSDNARARSIRAASSGSMRRSSRGEEDLGQRRRIGERARAVALHRRPELRAEPPHVDDPSLDDLGRRDQPLFERAVGGDSPQGRFDGRLVEGGVEGGTDQFVLVGEHPEDRALGDARGLGDLPARHRLAVFAQQRHDSRPRSGPPLVGGKTRRTS